MTLSSGDVAALARQAVDQTDPDADIVIVPTDPVDPYRFGGSGGWTITAGGRSSYISAGLDETEALAKLTADLSPSGSAD